MYSAICWCELCVWTVRPRGRARGNNGTVIETVNQNATQKAVFVPIYKIGYHIS